MSGEIELRFDRIYAAAHEDVPRQAAGFAEQVAHVRGPLHAAVAEVGKAGGGGLAGDLEALGSELLARLSRVVDTLNDSAVGLDRIADDFAHTDAEASGWFQEHERWVRDHGYAGTPDPVRIPSGSSSGGAS